MEESHTLHSVIPIKFRNNGTRCRGNNPRFVCLKAPVASQLNKLIAQPISFTEKKLTKRGGAEILFFTRKNHRKTGFGFGQNELGVLF